MGRIKFPCALVKNQQHPELQLLQECLTVISLGGWCFRYLSLLGCYSHTDGLCYKPGENYHTRKGKKNSFWLLLVARCRTTPLKNIVQLQRKNKQSQGMEGNVRKGSGSHLFSVCLKIFIYLFIFPNFLIILLLVWTSKRELCNGKTYKYTPPVNLKMRKFDSV